MLLTAVKMADAAVATNIPPGYDIAAGYYGGPRAYHIWSRSDWKLFPGHKLPIWVGGLNGTDEGHLAVDALKSLGVPANLHGMGTMTALDMETRHDETYVEAFQKVLNESGYLVWDYGSYSTVFRDPEANGYWVADYTDPETADAMLHHPGTRAIQYSPRDGYDVSLVKPWTTGFMWT